MQSMDPSATLCLGKPLFLQSLEESRAQLLRPIRPAAPWLNPLDAQSHLAPDNLRTCHVLGSLDGEGPSWSTIQAKVPQLLSARNTKPLLSSGFCEPHPLWLENHFLKEGAPTSFALQGLEETRARLLKPIFTSASQVASPKPIDVTFHLKLESPQNLCTLASTQLPPDPGLQNGIARSHTEPEEEQLLRVDGDKVDTAGEMPEYVLSVPKGSLTPQPEEIEPLEDELPPDSEDEYVKEQKLTLLGLVCCSLVEGSKFGKPSSQFQDVLMETCVNLAERDPEFILKVALYTRQELNIRSTANFLLVVSARLLPCRPHLRRYFCHAVHLPSDWMEIAQLFQTLATDGDSLAPMPSCLRAAMADKFRQFDAYQLAKYNSRKDRGKKQHPKTFTKMLQLRKEPKSKKISFSLKALIQRLHISEPAEHVMGLLGRRYPSDLRSFSQSRLPGLWDSSLAGTRMRLPKPLTWDRELSERGNKREVWEELLGAGKLPFMAMLRNLRNILKSGIGEKYHRRLLKRLEDKESVIRSKQLPFRFLSAYKVVRQLEEDLLEAEKPFPSLAQITQKIRQSIAAARQRKKKDRPDFLQLIMLEKKRLRKARSLRCNRAILQRYCQALEKAIGFAVRHNIPPIPGRTLILISCDYSMQCPYMKARDLCLPNLDQKDNPEQSNASLTIRDVAMLLGSMVYSASEQAEVLLCNQSTISGPVAMTGSVLEDVQMLQSLDPEPSYDDAHTARAILLDLLAQRHQVDTILLISHRPEEISDSVHWLYRHHVSPGCFIVNLCASSLGWDNWCSKNEVVLNGLSDQVLRFMAERGSSRFLEHVEKVDEIHNLPSKQGTIRAKEETGLFPLLPAPKSRWRSVRVFVSSTFRDMHGERDLLIRSVFPELRSRAAQFCLAVEDIDLRWGITEHESQRNKQLELCLSEVWQSQLFIGILGERYGHVPREYSLPDEPQYQWVKSYPAGRSITELEAMQFLGLCKNPEAESKAFFYFRDPDFLSSVPEAWRADFVAESEEARHRVADLKEVLAKREDLVSPRGYACQWGGVAQGRPYVKSLENFGVRVLEDIWECLQQHYIKEGGSTLADHSEEREEDFLQESFQELQQRRFCARAKLLHTVTAQLQGGRLYVVSGEAGQGKTVFLATLAQELRTKTLFHSQGPRPSYHVVAHFTRARPDQAEAQAVFGHLCFLLRKFLEQPPTPARSYRGLVSQFESLLHAVVKSLKRQQSLVVLIDGADLIHSANGQLVSDWLPEEIPQRVILVLSVSEESALLGSLKQRKNVTPIPLGPLDPPDRVAVVRKDLALYGKKLEESAFNNQMRLVLLKRGSRQPLYLTLLTQDLRLFAMFEKLSERIQKLPVSLPLLLQHLLGCLEQGHGVELVAVTLVLLWASRDGLKERDLYMILTTWKELKGVEITFEEAAVAGRQASAYPKAMFFDFLRSLRGLLGACGSLSEPPGSRIHLCGTPLRTAVEQRYLKKLGLDHTAHILLAAHWWKLSDPDGSRTFRKCEAESLRELPYHLVQSGRLDILASFLTDLNVVRIHIHLSLFHCLLEAYALYDVAAGVEGDETVGAFRAFLQKNLGLLSQNPQLLLQQAANEPDSSALFFQARTMLAEKGRPFLKWLNKPQKSQKTTSLVLTLPAAPCCVSIAPSGKLAAVGTVEGTLHLLDMETGQELKSLLSACAGISACEFLSETTVCLGTFNGRLELWSLKEGCRLMGTDAHRAQITDCGTNADHRLLATVSLDGTLKIWDSTSGCLAHERDCLSPLNCVTFHPKKRLVATGGWDKTVAILDADEMTVASVLKGHDASVHSVSFSSAGNILATGSLAGSIHLWSWQEAVPLGTFSAHSGCVSAVQFLPEGKLLTAGEDCKVQLWMGHLGQHWSTLGSTDLSPALCTAPSPDGSQLAVGYHEDDVWIYSHPWDSGLGSTHCQADGVAICSLAWLDNLCVIGGNNKGLLYIWNTSDCDPPCLHKWQGHDDVVTGLSVSGGLVASSSEDFTVRIWLSDTLKQGPKMGSIISPFAVLRGHTAGVTCCAFSQDGGCLASGGKDRALFIWDVSNPTQKAPSLLRSLMFCHQDWISTCAWIGSSLLSGSNDGTVSLWDPHTGQRLQEFLGHQNPVCGVTSETDRVVSMGRDGTLIAWDLQGVERTRFVAHPGQVNHCAGFTDSGGKGFMVAAPGYDGTVNLWKPLVMEQPQLLPGHCAAVSGAVASCASSSFLTASKDNTVRLWTLPKEEEKGGAKEFLSPPGAITALAWSSDGRFAVSGGEHGDLVIWLDAKAVETAKVGSSCIWAVAFTSPFTILVATDTIDLWDINTSRQPDGAHSLIHRKRLTLTEESTVLCIGESKPGGPLVLGLASGTFLVFQPGSESYQHVQSTGDRWHDHFHMSFDISASPETGILHVWNSMNCPSLFRMRVTSAGTLKEEMAPEDIPWEPKRPSVWVTVARLLNEELLLYADTEGYLWSQTRKNENEVDKWDLNGWQRRRIHNDRITSLHVLKDRIVTASYDRLVKIWERNPMKLLGQFQCMAPVLRLQPCPSGDSSLNLMAADTLGNIYFLEWSCFHG